MTDDPIHHFIYRTPHGPVTIAASNKGVCRVAFGVKNLAGPQKPTSLTNRTATELLEFFAGKRTIFDLPLTLQGSAFQCAVWQACDSIPFGQTRSCADIAAVLGNPCSYRNVGAAVRCNPLSVLVPTYRIVDAHGVPLESTHRPNSAAKLLALEQARG